MTQATLLLPDVASFYVLLIAEEAETKNQIPKE
jgi:hypothetical protein